MENNINKERPTPLPNQEGSIQDLPPIEMKSKKIKKVLITLIAFLLLIFIGIVAGFLGRRVLRNNRNICNFDIFDIEISYDNNSDTITDLYDKYKYETAKLSEETWYKYRYISAIENKIDNLNNSKWFEYKGVIRNNSKKKQYLIGIDAKLHTDDNILIGNGWSDLNKWLAPREAVPFKITIIINSKDLIDKYIKDGDYKLKTDFYPWSDTCNY